jgi:energy-coupling factor transport system substrate-specific component
MKRHVSWRIGRRELIAMLIGPLLYGGLTWLTNYMRLAEATNVDIRPGIAVVIVFGFCFGPIVGFVTGLLGNTLGDFWNWQSFWWSWTLGNGVVGLIPGLYALRWKSYRAWFELARAMAVVILSIIIGMGTAALLDIWRCRVGVTSPLCSVVPVTFDFTMREQFLPAVQVNVVSALFLVPVVLYNVERLDFGSFDWLHSRLLRRLFLSIFISAAIPTALLGFFLTQEFSTATQNTSHLYLKLGLTIVIALVFTVTNAGLVAQSISRPLFELTQAAQQMAHGKLTGVQAEALRTTTGKDEVAVLRQVFGQMAHEVIERERSLRRQVQELRIEIDDSRQRRQVAEITETDYFRDLQERAHRLRMRSSTSSDALDSAPDDTKESGMPSIAASEAQDTVPITDNGEELNNVALPAHGPA